MPTYRFYQIDVFTDVPFGGNPLAVFPDAEGLSDGDMQRLAREMNLSETTFVQPPTASGADYKVRIFTPSRELPFAGHPVVGTQWLLAHLGRTKLTGPQIRVTFELKVGLRAATLRIENGAVSQVVMDHMKPEFGKPATPEQVARLEKTLQLPTGAIQDTGFPVQMVSTGIHQMFAPIRSLKDIQAISPYRIDVGTLVDLGKELDPVDGCNEMIMVFSTETELSGSNIHTRVFVPTDGIPEDPATGSASGGVGAYLVQNKVLPATPPTTLIAAEQGLEMGRPSRVGIEVDGTPGAISTVRVSGQVVPLIEGTIKW